MYAPASLSTTFPSRVAPLSCSKLALISRSATVVRFPRQIATYYEPFLGGGSVLYELLGSDIEVGRIECSDACEPLIALWQVVKDDPNGLVEGSSASWTE